MSPATSSRALFAICFVLFFPAFVTADQAAKPVSFQADVLPIFREHCMGCHQPAAKRGNYLMTSFDQLVQGGESGEVAIVAGEPDKSALLQQIVPHDGSAAMPKDAPPLKETQIATIRQWIEQGAINDTSSNEPSYSNDNPPAYVRPPIITSLDYSPDGTLLAVSGYHEVLLFDTTTHQLKHRLIGLSPRIESLKFSHDGKRIAIAAGTPSVNGEIQIWDAADGKLLLSKFVTSDTLFGVDWSPDDKLISFACADNSIRCWKSDTAEQVLFQGAHEDWPRATVFSVAGDHVISAGRDMTVKLTEVATQRFIDNVTSITPGALRGGINALARHPSRDEIFVGSSDGIPKIYRVFRQTARQIGDDANLIRKLPEMPGRIFDVAISDDAQFLAAVSTLDQHSYVRVWKYETPENVPKDILDIQSKRVFDRTAEEKQKLEAFVSAEPAEVARFEINAAAYSIAISAGRTVSVGSADGMLRVWNIDNQQLKLEQPAIPPSSLREGSQIAELQSIRDQFLAKQVDPPKPESTSTSKSPAIETTRIRSLVAEPAKIDLDNWTSYAQLLITATLDDGSQVDVTRQVQIDAPNSHLLVHPSGFIEPKLSGDFQLSVSLAKHKIQIPVHVSKTQIESVDFVRDVNPVLSRLGCNQGTCHGSQAGKNGFKLSLRGYDPIYDIRSLTDDLAGRRINLSSPVESLIASKPLGHAPHAGGVLMHRGDLYSSIIEQWIAQGANFQSDSKQKHKVARIDVFPKDPVAPDAECSQQIRVVATYVDGSTRDVTRESFIESGNTEVAQVDRFGLATAILRGEAPLLARYEGNYAATTLTVMGNREGFEVAKVEHWTKLDELVAEKWARLKIQPSGLCSDSDFLRRIYLDLTGLPPSSDQVEAFLADPTPNRQKRDAVIDQLIGSPNYVAHWTNKWSDLLQVNSKFLGKEGAAAFRKWIADNVSTNRPYDEFVMELLTAQGSNRENPAASYYKILRTPEDTMENTTHLFLAVRFNCNKCHDHPFEKWTQDQYYETAAYFAQVGLKKDDASGDQTIGGTAVEGAKPLYEEVFDKNDGEVLHQRTQQAVAPKQPYDCDHSCAESASRRQKLASWLTSADNQYFARSYVNRLWGYLLGVGLIEPLDDIRAGNPPSIPAVLDELEREFIASDFNVQHMVRLICKSRVYQLDSGTNDWNADDQRNYSHAIARRLPAEVLYDAVHFVTGTETTIPGVDKGTRAASLPDADAGLPDGFLNNLGRPVRESACECERSSDLQLGAVMALLSGPTVGNAISENNNALHQLVSQTSDNKDLVNKLYLRVLNRPALQPEIDACQPVFDQVANDHAALQKSLEEKEVWWTAEREKRETIRVQSLAQAKEKLAAREAEIADDRVRQETERKAKEDHAVASAETYRAQWQSNLNQWLSDRASGVQWDLLAPTGLTATNNAELRPQSDRSIIATGNKDKGIYHITARPALDNVTAIRLEALTAPDVAGGGPGLPGNGNFVLTEIELFAGPAHDPASRTKLKIKEAKTDFDQAGFSGAAAIDDKLNDQGGWAIANAGGTEHWAVFALEQPLVLTKDWVIEVRLHQFHDAAEHRLAHFRLSVANHSGELKLGLSENLAALLSTPGNLRNDSQIQLANAYFTKTDAEYARLQAAIAEARKPLAPDEQVVAIQTAIARLEKPTLDDASVIQLRADFEQSKKQLEQVRVTAAEDITWALINSPAFLFNH